MDYQQYLDEKIHQLRVVCRAQWDYVGFADVCAWLEDNFGDDIEGRYYATKILLHTVYYKKKDIEKLLLHGLYDKIYGQIIKKELLLSGNIFIPNSEASGRVNKLKERSFFIPLLDTNKPHESGNGVVGDLVHKLQVGEDQVDFHWNVTIETLRKYQLLIFVDDCIGSGMQLKKFWNSPSIQEIRKVCEQYGIQTYYLVLVGFDKNLELLSKSNKINGIEIVVCDLLTEKNRIFSEKNIVWETTDGFDERKNAMSYFEELRKRRGVSFLGFKKLDFAIILHDRLPNWSLPILWQDKLGWKNLVTRKTSIK